MNDTLHTSPAVNARYVPGDLVLVEQVVRSLDPRKYIARVLYSYHLPSFDKTPAYALEMYKVLYWPTHYADYRSHSVTLYELEKFISPLPLELVPSLLAQ